MADWPQLRCNNMMKDDHAPPTYFATITGNAAANTKGAYTQVVASLPYSISGMLLEFVGSNAAYVLADIAVGAGGSEQVIIPNLTLMTGGNLTITVYLPIAIRAGRRVSMRAQGSAGSSATKVKVHFIADTYVGMQPLCTRWIDWGANLGTSRGTVVTAGTMNVKGAWTQLVAAADFTTKWLMAALTVAGGARDVAIDIGVGAGGSEQVIIADLYSAMAGLGVTFGPVPLSIRAGTRVAVRIASLTAGDTLPIIVYGGG